MPTLKTAAEPWRESSTSAVSSSKGRTYNKVFAKVINSLSGIIHEGISKPLHPVVNVLGHCLPRHAVKQRQDGMQLVQLTTQLPVWQCALMKQLPWIQGVDMLLIVAMIMQSAVPDSRSSNVALSFDNH